jgi:hypothetical protein
VTARTRRRACLWREFAIAKSEALLGDSSRLQAVHVSLLIPAPRPKRLIPGATGDWEVIIGLEVHAQVTVRIETVFRRVDSFGAAPNANVSLVDAAMPGMLPVINEECVRQAIRSGLGLKAQINLKSVFDRKNYFYPDLPQGYQISQFKQPIVGEGEIVISVGPDREGKFEDIPSASSACIWSRMPANRCTTSTQPCPMST